MPEFAEVGEGGAWEVMKASGERIPLGTVSGVHSAGRNYIVYDCQPEDSRWVSLQYAHSSALEPGASFNAIWNASISIYTQAKSLIDEAEVAPLISLLAAALANALEEDEAAARDSVEKAERWLADVNTRKLTPRFVEQALTGGALMFLAGLLLVDVEVFASPSLRAFGLALEFAPLGALLSMLPFRKGDALPFDAFGTVAQCRDSALRRLLVGVLSAVGALLLLDSGVVSSTMVPEAGEAAAYSLIAFAAGFSERWGSQLVERIPGFERPPS